MPPAAVLAWLHIQDKALTVVHLPTLSSMPALPPCSPTTSMTTWRVVPSGLATCSVAPPAQQQASSSGASLLCHLSSSSSSTSIANDWAPLLS